MTLTDFDALSFDCYGTLIDWESGMVAGLAPLTRQVENLSRNAILEAHAQAESSQQAQTPGMRYSDLLAVVYKRLAERWGVSATHAECLTYGASVKDWPAFPDSADALAYLKQHYKLIILSNVDNASFAGSNERLGVTFDAIYSAEDVGAYKPSDRNFEYMLDRLPQIGVERPRLLHVAESMFHDHVPAKRHGLTNCWIYRRHDDEGFGATMNPGEMPAVDMRFNSMAELADAHRAARG
ncbi:haloacid dehalogenase type II [Acuticoccus sp. MNP-M23]|uniref:haloacid dehalogenase type II n=1 Tax=Acuticoccus sp. MNP-M23 TaxID=3072793 RepID=UPI00281676F0|nr:haloacid dehalogenase type II [Acuticoccus sp. MNP-M23]WMS42835.1 haloacid dehalogenase type II [Acuticoccus sp. MNP-M23]